VRIRVRACALNHLDLWERRGLDRVRIPLPHISGSDVSGDVAEAGRGDVPVGTRVMLQPGQSLRVAVHAPKTTSKAGGASNVSEKPVRYRVKRGDTLWEIARSHDVTPEELSQWNELTHRAKLRVGQELTIHLDRS